MSEEDFSAIGHSSYVGEKLKDERLPELVEKNSKSDCSTEDVIDSDDTRVGSGAVDNSKINEKSDPKEDGDGSGEKRKMKKKYTPEEKMFIYCEKGTPYHVNYMLDKHPYLISICDSDKYTPLHRACYSNNVQVVRILIERGADIHARTDLGWTPLHSAAKWSALESASVLIDSGADVNARSDGNVTPLHLASATQSPRLIELFLHHPDIDINIKTNGGDTAYDIACRSSPFYQLFENVSF